MLGHGAGADDWAASEDDLALDIRSELRWVLSLRDAHNTSAENLRGTNFIRVLTCQRTYRAGNNPTISANVTLSIAAGALRQGVSFK